MILKVPGLEQGSKKIENEETPSADFFRQEKANGQLIKLMGKPT